MGRARASLRPLLAVFALVTGGNEQTEAGKEGHPPDCRGVGVDKNTVLAGSCCCWLYPS